MKVFETYNIYVLKINDSFFFPGLVKKKAGIYLRFKAENV